MRAIALAVRALCFTVLMLSLQSASACEILVRDVAFRLPRDVHRLCVMARSGDTEANALMDELSAWLDGSGRDLNLALERVDVDHPNVEWSEYGIPSAPPVLPVVVLVGSNHAAGPNFVIDHWEPGPSAEDLELLSHSPVRERLEQELGRRLAVLLYAPAHGSGGGAAKPVLEQTVAQWSARGELGISVVRLERTDESERTLLSFTGLDPQGPDWVGVVFGRGKLMAPPLQGEEITVERLNELIDQLTQECACSKPLPSMGVDVPLVWTDRLDEAVLTLTRPESDDGWLGSEQSDAPSTTSLGAPDLPSTEAVVSGGARRPQPPGPASAQSESAINTTLLTTVAWTLVAAALFVVLITGTLLRRKGQRSI